MAKNKYTIRYLPSFTIFYTVRNNIIEITHLIYSARDFDKLI